MTRERYTLILPVLVFTVVAAGFLLGVIFPSLSDRFFLAVALGGGAVIVVIDRLARRRVAEPISDERLQGIGEKAAFLSFRIATGAMILCAFGAIVAFPAPHPLRYIGVGAATTIGLQALVYTVAYTVIRSRS